LKEAQDSGTFPLSIALSGFGDLAKQDGNYVEKTSLKGTYTIGDWGVQISSLTPHSGTGGARSRWIAARIWLNRSPLTVTSASWKVIARA
jgi:hypothetical protein